MLAAAGLMFTACNDDYKDWNEPQSQPQPELLSVDFQAAGVNAFDLRSITADSVQLFTPTITVNKPYTVSYDAVIYNDSKTDSVIVGTNVAGKAGTSAVQGAIQALYGADEVQRDAPMTVVAKVNTGGTITMKQVDGLKLSVTPRYQDLPDVWYILGNCIGRGTWVNHSMTLYTNTVAMYVNPFNFDEQIYASYFPAKAEFYIAPELGNKKNIIGMINGNIAYQDDRSADAKTPGNIIIDEAGYYKITVNVKTYAVSWEPITSTVKLYTGMKTIGIDTDMQLITKAASGENHDWLGTVTVTEDGQLIGFEGTGDGFTSTWGGKAFPAGKASAGAAGIPAKAGSYNVVFNDLLGVYRFIEK